MNVGIALLAVSLVQGFVAQVFQVPSQSMRNTLNPSDRILANRLAYIGANPARGDIVVFGHGDTWDAERRSPAPDFLRAAARAFGDVTGIGPSNTMHTVKRVIGVGGDTVQCCDSQGSVVVNGKSQAEPYLGSNFPFTPGTQDCTTASRSGRCFGPIVVPAETLLLMGDNRVDSADSVIGCRSAASNPATCVRLVPVSRVVGKVGLRLWPPGLVG